MESEPKVPYAWQPFTPAGVAAFRTASFKRLWLVQLLVAMLAAAAVVWFVGTDWFPVIRAAIRQFPGQGVIRHGELSWQGERAVKFAENHFLALTLDLQHEGLVRSPAQFQVELGAKDVVFLSILGVLQVPYPDGYIITLRREQLEPWWGAWAPPSLALLGLATIAWLLASWTLLALIYSPVALLIAFFANRELRFGTSVRLCGAALMPGAFFLTVFILLYGLGAFDILKLLLAAGVHFLIGWIYVVAALFFCPRVPGAPNPKVNPFSKG